MNTYLANVRAGLTPSHRTVLWLAGFGFLAAAGIAGWALGKHAWIGVALAVFGAAICAGTALDRMFDARRAAAAKHRRDSGHQTRREIVSAGQEVSR